MVHLNEGWKIWESTLQGRKDASNFLALVTSWSHLGGCSASVARVATFAVPFWLQGPPQVLPKHTLPRFIEF